MKTPICSWSRSYIVKISINIIYRYNLIPLELHVLTSMYIVDTKSTLDETASLSHVWQISNIAICFVVQIVLLLKGISTCRGHLILRDVGHKCMDLSHSLKHEEGEKKSKVLSKYFQMFLSILSSSQKIQIFFFGFYYCLVLVMRLELSYIKPWPSDVT